MPPTAGMRKWVEREGAKVWALSREKGVSWASVPQAPGSQVAPPASHVIVSWQPLTWTKRPIRDFEQAFLREVAQRPAAPGVLREVEQLRPADPMPHDAMVPLVLRRWLPSLLSAEAAPDLPCVSP